MWSKKLLSILLWGAFFRSLSFASAPRKIYNHFIQFEKIKSGFSLLHVEENSTHENWAKDAKCKKLQNIDFFPLLCFSRFVLHSMMMFLQDLFYLNMSLDDMHKSILKHLPKPHFNIKTRLLKFPSDFVTFSELAWERETEEAVYATVEPFSASGCLSRSFILCAFMQIFPTRKQKSISHIKKLSSKEKECNMNKRMTKKG